jgi:VanZ family protein
MSAISFKNGLLTVVMPISLSFLLWLSALTILFILFFIGGPSYYSSQVYKEFWNIGHIVFFVLSTYQLITFFKGKSSLTIAFISLTYCLILGSAIELLQSRIGRSMDLHDLYRDILGTFLALTVFYYKTIRHQKYNKKHFRLSSISLLILSIFLITLDQKSLAQAIKLSLQAHNNFPILADFESSDELKQWKGNSLSLSTEHVLTGLFSMKVELSSKTKYSGFILKEMPRNWKGYSYLLINIYNPDDDSLKINAKITDYEHDLSSQRYNNRYNNSYTLLPGQWNTIKIKLEDIKNSPKNRKLNLTEMSQLGLFTLGLKENKIIYLDVITLI